MKDNTRKMVEDRIIIKATQRLRRHIQPRELSQFLVNNKYQIDKLETEFIKGIDKLILEFLEKKL